MVIYFTGDKESPSMHVPIPFNIIKGLGVIVQFYGLIELIDVFKLHTYFIPEGPLRRNRHLEQRKAEQK
jgi:hypothetical protein